MLLRFCHRVCIYVGKHKFFQKLACGRNFRRGRNIIMGIFYNRGYHFCKARSRPFAEDSLYFRRDGSFRKHAGAHRVLKIVVSIGKMVRKFNYAAFGSIRRFALCMANNAVAHFIGKVKAFAVPLKNIHHA